jgi:aminoglycoside/choline kinase family phosphotransferase
MLRAVSEPLSRPVTDPAPTLDDRAQAARDWALEYLREPRAQFAPASADASFRRYFRLSAGERSWVLMDAPPEREDCKPFLQVAALLREAGLHGPEILAQDLERGFLLLSDLGRQTYLQEFQAGLDADEADRLMRDAIAALVCWQAATRPGVLPPYDRALLQRELDLFPDWYVARHLERELTPAQRARLDAVNALLIDSALAQPRVYVHRDYMPRNLMRATPNPGVLDFQDAVEGPITYDLISLFKDAFWSWPAAPIEAWIAHYRRLALEAGLPVEADAAMFRRAADWMGLQRHLKVIGIFARICHRDGKPHYLQDVPRFIGYVRDVAAQYDELAPLLQLFDELGMTAPRA